MTGKTKPLRLWTGPSGQEYELWPEHCGCGECALRDTPIFVSEDCIAAPCAFAILRLPNDPPSWAKEQK